MIHLVLDQPLTHAVDELPEDVGLHDGEGHRVSPELDTVPDLTVAQPDHTGSVDLNDLLVRQKTVPGRGAVDCDGGDSPGPDLDPQPARPVLVEQETPGQRPVPHVQHDVVDWGTPSAVILKVAVQHILSLN